MDFSFLTFRSERFRADRWHFAGARRWTASSRLPRASCVRAKASSVSYVSGTFCKGYLRTVPCLLTAEVVENPKCFIVCSLQGNTTDSQSLEWRYSAAKGGIRAVLGC